MWVEADPRFGVTIHCKRLPAVGIAMSLQALLAYPIAELRTQRLPELFESIDQAEEDDMPLITALVDRAFEGDDGLAVLRTPEVQHAICGTALAHADTAVRCFTLVLCKRLTSSPPDVRILCESGVLPAIAGLVGDSSLAVADKATQVFVACAESPDCLRAALEHTQTRERLLALLAPGPAGGLPTVGLRTLAMFGAMAGLGEEQYSLCEACGAFAPALAAWNGDDELVRLNALEIFPLLARHKRGMEWLRGHGVLAGLVALVVGSDADGDGVMVTLALPSVLHCLASLLEYGDDETAEAVLGADGLLLRAVWPRVEPSAGHANGARDASLALVRAAACTRRGLLLVLGQLAEQGGAGCVGKQLKSSDQRAKVSALGVVAQLCSSSARYAADADVARAQPTLRALVAAVSPRESTAAADALATLVALPTFEVRVAALRLLLALAQAEWGALLLANSEAVLDFLMHSGLIQLTPDELRDKHALAGSLLKWPSVVGALGAGSGTVRHLQAYADAGPFAYLPRAGPQVMGPLTL